MGPSRPDETSRLLDTSKVSAMPEDSQRRGSAGEMKEQKRYIGGLILLMGVVILWTASNFITASLETGDDSYNKPFFITYLNTASFVIYLIPSYFKYRKAGNNKSYQSIPSAEDGERISLPPSPRIPLQHEISPEGETDIDVDVDALPKLSVSETARIAGWWALFWFLANWSLNVSLAWTSVASVTILSSTSGFFCLALGRVYGVEAFSRDKVFAAIASFIGVVLVTHSDSSLSASQEVPPTLPDGTPVAGLPAHPILGDFAALMGAALYSVYVVYMKVKVGDEDRADMQLLLGFAGLFCIVGLLPVIPILHWSGWETFELPPTRSAWVICGINMCITLSSDYLYVLALLKTAPMIGLSLTIPIALLASIFVPSASASAITLTSLSGAALVCAGFAIMGQQGYKESQEKEERRQSDLEARRIEALERV